MNDEYYMKKALAVANQALAKDEFPVGCVAVYNSQVIAAGGRTGTAKASVNEIEHAEMITLKQLSRLDLKKQNGPLTLYCTLEPCLMCFGAILLSPVDEIVYAYEDIMGGGTGCDLNKLTPLYRNRRISITPHILRQDSVKLFKAFFGNHKNTYWQGSLLADYTFKQ
jgi:tRNA(adenine34) deaminase